VLRIPHSPRQSSRPVINPGAHQAREQLRDEGEPSFDESVAVPMALHDTVVRRIKTWHEDQGDDVTAELRGYAKPPKFYGSRGRAYIPDVFVFNKHLAYEVKEYWAYRNAAPKLKAISSDPRARRLILVLCSGTGSGVDRVEAFLEREDVNCEVVSYRDLPFW
jgi:hypothetical protein